MTPALPLPASRKGANIVALAAIAGGFAAAAVLSPVAVHNDVSLSLCGLTLPPLCAFRIMTGLPCAGCGLTRSVVLLMHGNLAGSLAAHPFGWVAALLALALVPPRAVRALGRDAAWIGRYDRLWGIAVASTMVAMFVWWVVRIGPLLLSRTALG